MYCRLYKRLRKEEREKRLQSGKRCLLKYSRPSFLLSSDFYLRANPNSFHRAKTTFPHAIASFYSIIAPLQRVAPLGGHPAIGCRIRMNPDTKLYSRSSECKSLCLTIHAPRLRGYLRLSQSFGDHQKDSLPELSP